MNFIYPDYMRNSIYNLACGIADFLGAKRECRGNKINISGKKLALILLDGLGYNMLKSVGLESENKITTVFPSTTSTVLTTLFTAQLPGEHGILGYNTLSKRLGGIANALRFTYPAIGNRDTVTENIKFSSAFPNVKSYLTEVKDKKTAEVIPKGIDNTEFTLATHGKVSTTKTYVTYWDALYEFSNILQDYDFVYFYIPDIDTLAHKYGPSSLPVKQAIKEIFEGVRQIALHHQDYIFVITADHGHVEASSHILLNQDTELLDMLYLPPYGDSRALFFLTKFDLKTYLYHKYPELKVFEKVDFERLVGAENINADFIAVPSDNKAYIYSFKDQTDDYAKLKGHHGGLSEDEMYVPLVILNG
ncbi:alkaline phosphatase family protein [Sulfurisphaera ohwakuensis]|uniref:PglZ domain-containing protein n=1 Tax=Sulfurisphaera ohwakuensis TaxID=69656 RepID=A0A650CEL2_SULOH|nr:alkaline phosphatase family protein [Sulfurisphaera ohwakuensis]MBB5252859.1 putative AlkP superfamily pyrophosphatase or phosphodiesterase [Sulfurisphaera ohwakuensis]QGR16206.1 PglZ domain-containing protein [Sulfurisphaera ohwakuensis]